MIRAGFAIENPLTQSRTVVLEGDLETNNTGWLLEVHAPAHAGPDIAEHYHLTWTEEFEILSGTAYYKLDGVQKTASAGEKFTVRPNQRHVHPWNAGPDELVFRQRDHFGQASPQALQEVLGTFATIAGLAKLGQVDANGRPKNPLQAAVTLKTLIKHGGYDAGIPVPAQKFLAATLAPLAQAFGYKAIYPQYVNE